MRRREGFALLIVLWMLVPLSVLFLTLAGVARSDSRLTFNLRDAATLAAAADGGIETAVLGLIQPGGSTAPLRLSLAGASVVVRMESLSGLVNPNIAAPELLRAVLVRIGTDPARADRLAGAIVDWRTPSQQRRADGAKAAEYRAAGLDYGPPGAPFESLGELRLVLGMTPPTYDALRPLLTLFSDRPPDPASAPPAVRSALGDIGVRGGATAPRGTVFLIAAKATNGRGGRVVRQATIRLVASERSRPWRVLAWETAPLP